MEDIILQQIAYINGRTHGSRPDQVILVRDAIETGILTKEQLAPMLEIIKDIPFVDSNGGWVSNTVFENVTYIESIEKLKAIFSAEDTREIVSIFLNIRGSEFHTSMKYDYMHAIENLGFSESDADYIVLTLILVDFRVNLKEERINY